MADASDGHEGLTSQEAARILAEDGANELSSARKRGLLTTALGVVREPMILLLLVGFGVYLVLGDAQGALTLLSFVLVVIGITLVQERRTESALERLRDLSSPRALVVRDGRQARIPGREVVRGDLVLLSEGDRVPADGVVLQSRNLTVDESVLTGESIPVVKGLARPGLSMTGPGEPDSDRCVYSGTLVVKGQAAVRVEATGPRTEFGAIGGALEAIEPGASRLQRQIRRLVRALAIGGVALSVLVALLFALTRGDWLEGVLAGVTLAMAVLPEEFPVVLTVFLALGAWRLSQQHTLARRMAAIETLGAATVVAVDKTGTLTQNRMSVRELRVPGVRHVVDGPLPEDVHRLVEYAVLASPVDPFDPMDVAFRALAERYLAQTEHIHRDWDLVREYPLSEELMALSHTWRSPDGGDFVIAAKGAPEAIAELCHLDEDESSALCAEVSQMAAEGLRVLGTARASFRAEEPLPPIQHDFAFELVGLVGLEDPLRPAVPEAMKQCATAGVRVLMLTGDYPETARAVAARAGMPGDSTLMTGAEIAASSDDDLRVRLADTLLFARVIPSQKLRLVQALKGRGEVVAMTGDGVNDAPALKAADIGIAMGAHGTDVAREAADIVLVDDDFSSIVSAMRTGRRVFDNLRKAMAYIVAVHIPIAGMSLLPVLTGRPLLLLPAHVAFLELIIDPASSVVFEAEEAEADIMRRPPRPPDEPLFSGRVVWLAVLQGLASLSATAIAYFAGAPAAGATPEQARALGFAMLVATNIGLLLANIAGPEEGGRGLRNKPLAVVLAATAILFAAVVYVPWLRGVFSLAAVPPVWLLGIGAGAVVVLLTAEALERAFSRR